jgi:hypothetical protein
MAGMMRAPVMWAVGPKGWENTFNNFVQNYFKCLLNYSILKVRCDEHFNTPAKTNLLAPSSPIRFLCALHVN